MSSAACAATDMAVARDRASKLPPAALVIALGLLTLVKRTRMAALAFQRTRKTRRHTTPPRLHADFAARQGRRWSSNLFVRNSVVERPPIRNPFPSAARISLDFTDRCRRKPPKPWRNVTRAAPWWV